MKVYNDDVVVEMTEIIQHALQVVRNHRQFDVEKYIQAKIEYINNYFCVSHLNTAVVALSGGVDSAVVFALLDEAKKAGNSEYLENIVPVCIPALNNTGVTHQSDANDRAKELCEKFGYTLNTIVIDDAVNAIDSAVREKIQLKNSDWSIGQLVPYTRTPTLYYITSLLSDSKHPAVIAGTTNRDEGAYLGYVGKASDGMVDLQIISDLHKSEVYQVAKALGVPDSIINVAPNGDMFDGRDDVELFGASYDYVELVLGLKDLPVMTQKELRKQICDHFGSYRLFSDAEYNLGKLHSYNSHKYKVGSPAYHMDIMPSGTEGGWKLDYENLYRKEMFNQGNIIRSGFVSPVLFNNQAANEFIANYYHAKKHSSPVTVNDTSTSSKIGDIIKIENIITESECELLRDIFESSNKIDANVHGRLTAIDTNNDGSQRVSWYNVEFADLIWGRIRNHIELLFNDEAGAGYSQHGYSGWHRAVGINPLMRFIGYNDHGMLVPHYDYSYVDDKSGLTSMLTVVIYLTTNDTGATRFIVDKKGPKNGLDDWTYNESIEFNKTATEDDFILVNKPVSMTAVVFPHYKLHDCEEVIGEHKLIIRTDIMCKNVMVK